MHHLLLAAVVDDEVGAEHAITVALITTSEKAFARSEVICTIIGKDWCWFFL